MSHEKKCFVFSTEVIMGSFAETVAAYSTVFGKSKDEVLGDIHTQYQVSKEYSLAGRSVLGKVIRVVDGDSLKVAIPLDGKTRTFPVRIANIDCPEIRTRNAEDKALGFQAKARVEELTLDKLVSVDLGEFDKFGRLLGKIYTADDVNVGDDLISMGLAVDYTGGKRPSWCVSK